MAKQAAKSANTAEIAGHGYVLRPGRYVGAEEVETDGEPFEEKMSRLVTEWRWQMGRMGQMGPMRRVFSDARSHQPPCPRPSRTGAPLPLTGPDRLRQHSATDAPTAIQGCTCRETGLHGRFTSEVSGISMRKCDQ